MATNKKISKLLEGMELKQVRKMLFTPCKTQKELENWMKVFLDLELPNCTVDERSNSNPMANVWEIYEKALKNDDPDFNRVLAYACRDGAKTLSASVVELLSLFHLERSLVHMAATEDQSSKALYYMKEYSQRPFLRDFVAGNSKRTLEIVKYVHTHTGDILCKTEWSTLPKFDQDKYEQHSFYNKVAIGTLRGANGQHAPLCILDELDICNPVAFEEAKMIPASFKGKDPITLLTSSRKFAYGLVQKEIDDAAASGLHIRHWNIIDVSQRCPDTRHRPDLPKVDIYYNEETLKAYNEQEFTQLNDEVKKDFTKTEGFDGCVNGRCKIFAACRGRLATHQTSTSPVLKKVDVVQNLFKAVALETAKSQLLCWKPSSEGMIYSRLDFNKHTLLPHQIAEMVLGQKYPINYSKQQLVTLLKNNERVKFFAGMDFGFTDAFAVVVGAVFGSKCFIIEAFELEELELQDQIDICNQKIKSYDPVIYADTSSPGSIKTFQKNKFNMRNWKKLPTSILDGINIVRAKISPVIGEPELFFLRGDEGCEKAFKQMAVYHWQTDAAGDSLDVPEGGEDHTPDAVRYMIMNVFSDRNKALLSSNSVQDLPNLGYTPTAEPTTQNYLRHFIDEALNDAGPNLDPTIEQTGGKGRLKWSF